MKFINLYTGTNVLGRDKNLKWEFKAISWWSRDLATIKHYYEGHVIQILVYLDENIEDEFVVSYSEVDPEKYTWGSAILTMPMDAIWYSFSANYLKTHVLIVKEVDIDELNLKNDIAIEILE